MTITRKNFDILKKAALIAAETVPAVFLAIEETETESKKANARTAAYITAKRKINKNYCR